MQILVDPHVHTLASRHAFSTVQECIQAAKDKGLEGIAVTDHMRDPMGDEYHAWQHFFNMQAIPPVVDGVRVFRGAEVDIVDLAGTLVASDDILAKLELVIASVHPNVPLGKPWETKEQHTKAYIHVLNNPYVDILGHSGTPEFAYDHEAVLTVAKQQGKMIEINNSSHKVRPSSRENCLAIAAKCKELGVWIVVSSDAHACFGVGSFEEALALLESIDFPQELVANRTLARFTSILESRRKRGQ